MYTWLALLFWLTTALNTESLLAAGPPETAAVLGGPELTPLGAERAGNADGSIPAWTGGITMPPANYDPGRQHADPFADDPVVLRISADNMEPLADKLSEGQKALLRAYPDSWHLNVYPTRRSASYPDWVYAAVKANAATAKVVREGKGGVVGSNVSSPFPLPKSGVEVMWNHNLRWRGIRISRSFGQAAVTRKGRYTVTLALQDWALPYGAPAGTSLRRKFPNLLIALKSKTVEPGLLAGNGALTLEPIDQTADPRKTWEYNRELRRILRLPNVAHDFPAFNTDNLRTIDEFDMFNGSPEYYKWRLLGKRELYIPYNAYRLHSSDADYSDIIKTRHINPDLARYELHRVWVVEGTLKPGKKHIYHRRVFYLDEDSWQVAVADNYDKDGTLWRTSEAHALNYYEVPVQWSTLEVYYDLKAERYLVSGLDNQRNPYRFSEDADPREFSPNALSFYIR
ncbi:MAG: DUF1329 domain-containing protein [Gammaproteobacteria bacterium]|jgi:hypothetical protein